MKLDPTITWGHILTIVTLIVSFALAAIFWHTRLIIVEGSLLNIAATMEIYEDQRKERDSKLMDRLARIDEKLDRKEDK